MYVAFGVNLCAYNPMQVCIGKSTIQCPSDTKLE